MSLVERKLTNDHYYEIFSLSNLNSCKYPSFTSDPYSLTYAPNVTQASSLLFYRSRLLV